MSDHTTADDIAAIFREEAAPIFAEHFHADRYELVEVVTTDDGWGGSTTEETVVESGRCALDMTSMKGGETVRDDIGLVETAYTAELPRTSIATPSHTLKINGRTFDVVDVKRDGNFGMFTMVACEEAGPRT